MPPYVCITVVTRRIQPPYYRVCEGHEAHTASLLPWVRETRGAYSLPTTVVMRDMRRIQPPRVCVTGSCGADSLLGYVTVCTTLRRQLLWVWRNVYNSAQTASWVWERGASCGADSYPGMCEVCIMQRRQLPGWGQERGRTSARRASPR